MQKNYKRMAGTSAVFVLDSYQGASPVERDGLVWSEAELHLQELSTLSRELDAMANALALEGLEDYDPPQDGDIRPVRSLGVRFAYLARARAWVQLPD